MKNLVQNSRKLTRSRWYRWPQLLVGWAFYIVAAVAIFCALSGASS